MFCVIYLLFSWFVFLFFTKMVYLNPKEVLAKKKKVPFTCMYIVISPLLSDYSNIHRERGKPSIYLASYIDNVY